MGRTSGFGGVGALPLPIESTSSPKKLILIDLLPGTTENSVARSDIERWLLRHDHHVCSMRSNKLP